MKQTTQNITQQSSHNLLITTYRMFRTFGAMIFLVMALLTPMTIQGQVPDVTMDTNENGVIDDDEKNLYLIQTNQFPSFYMAPKTISNVLRVTTNNIPCDNMLWYFLDAGTDSGTQYYYIVNNSENKYICHGGGTSNDAALRGVQLVEKNSDNEERCKFKLVENNESGQTGFYNIDVKGSPTYFALNKESGNVDESKPIRLTNNQWVNNMNSRWKFIPYNGTYTWPTPPFTPSTNSLKHYYKIHNVQNSTYYVSTSTTTDTMVTYASTASNRMVWYFEEAPADPSTPWFKYYYIVNPESCMNMYYRGTTTNGTEQTDAVIVKPYGLGEEDRYQFIVVQAARTTGGDDPVVCYAIIPKLLRGIYWGSNSLGSKVISDGSNMGIIKSRGANNSTAQWNFEVASYAIAAPTITINCDNSVSLSAPDTPDGDIYYNVGDGSQPDPTNESTPFVNPFTPNVGQVVKAVVYHCGVKSNVTTSDPYSATHTEAPSITYNATTITITGPEGSTIYYTVTAGNSGTDPIIGNPGTSSGSTPVNIFFDGTQTDVRAIAKVSTMDESCVTRLVTLATPTVTIDNGECNETSPTGNLLTITDTNVGGTLWYAVTAGENSDAPDINATPNPYGQYTAPIVLDDLDGSNTYYTVHAYSQSSDGVNHSGIVSVSRLMKTGGKPLLTPPVGSSPVVHIEGGVFGDVAVCSATGVATQQVPIASDGTADYSIPSNASGTLSVAFKHGNWQLSCDSTYIIPAAPAKPEPSQSCDNKLSLSTTSPMAIIHYILDGEESDQVTLSSPTYFEGSLYSIMPGTRVRAKAFEGFLSSELLDYTYQPEHVAAPTFFVDGVYVTISSATSGASIYYTVSTNENNNEDDPIADPDDPDPTDPSQLFTADYELRGITKIKAIAVKDGMENSCIILVTTREGYSITNVTELNTISGDPDKTGKYWFIENDFNASGYNGPVDFTGVLVGNYHAISGLTTPLFNETSGSAVVHDLNLKEVNIPASTAGNVGAIACTAKGNTRIYNCGILPTTADGTSTSQVGGTGKVGGMVGILQDNARVINCFSYADITSGTHRGGIVGYNSGTSNQTAVTTMIMNCMFYGDISTSGSPTQIAPVYGGTKISNSGNKGLNNFNYFRFNSPYVSSGSSITYNCALGAKDRNLERFEFYRLILNSNHKLASWYIKETVIGASERVGHWVLDKSLAPYPILKTGEGVYPSIINPDAAHAIPIDPDNIHRNEGRKLGELTVSISGVGSNAPTGAAIKSGCNTRILNITDKDEANYNFNYKKVQLPYYNEIGTNNYTENKVVTGWKITAFDQEGTGTFCNNTYDFPCYNFVDRTCTDKDKYSVSGRVFNQGAYYEVPDGVTAITIEPYWANCVYLSDSTYDVTYNNMASCPVETMGKQPKTFNGEQTVYNNVFTAIDSLNSGTTVYDAAVVLVGNYHHFFNATSINPNKTLTIMSVDMDNDNEPDNSFFYQHYDRREVAPMRFDFINIPGIGMAQKEDGRQNDPQPGIFHATGWFEITNTVLISFGQFEFAKSSKNNIKPVILHGGIYEQFVSTNNGVASYQYIFVGGNSWFKEFNVGCHTRETAGKTPKRPVSVAGGDFEKFYLSGRNKPEQVQDSANAVCYIDGGRFGEVAGAGMQQIRGNVTWLINGADITSFFGGGINAAKPIRGNISTTISNSWVDEFCGGPKFGDMANGKTVTTVANDCNFGKFFGAGYGGTAYNRFGHVDESDKDNYDAYWNTWVDTYYLRAYSSNPKHIGISTSYEYEYFFYSGGRDAVKVGRLYVNYASLSLASTRNVSSTLSGCTIGDFYGGGKLGAVNGDVVSTLTDCTVTGDVFGSGYSAAVPTVEVTKRENSSGTVGFETKPYYDNKANVFNDEQVSPPVPPVVYTWSSAGDNDNPFTDDGDEHFIHTDQPLNNLGAVLGNATLTINGNTVVKGDVYGGGALSSSNTNSTSNKIQVNINGGTYGETGAASGGNIYGGGMGNAQNAVTEGTVELNIGNSSQSANNVVINGNVYGCNNYNGSPQGDVSVDVWVTKHDASNTASNTGGGYAIANVFGGGHLADYTPAGKAAHVTIHGCQNTIGRVFGGGDAAAAPGVVTVIDGGRFDWVFGGGNGEVIAANIGAGGANISVHGGKIHHLFGGSNTNGTISGDMVVNIDNEGGCDEYIDEFFGGCNLVELGTVDDPVALSTTIGCGTLFGSVYGGSNKANIYGDVTLTIEGGEIENVYGGSKGVAEGDETYPDGLSADISGNVTLNLAGGTIANAFGGSNILGSIDGNITVNVEDAEDPDCPLILTDVFGGGNLAVYNGTPAVNVKHGTVLGNVYGGGNGDPADNTQTKGSTGAPTVVIGDADPDHKAVVEGDVYGGGNAAKVTGSTTTTVQVLNKCNTEIGYVYGGGNAADVPAASVSIAGGTIHHDVFGGGHGDKASLGGVHTDKQANVDGDVSVSITGATIDRVFAGSNINGSIDGDITLSIDKSADANCDMIIHEVYGGGNMADGKAANITIGCTGNIDAGENGHVAHPENIGTSLEGIGTLYGGANQAGISNDNDIELNINSGIINKVFGGNNTSGEIASGITVNIEKDSDCGWYVGDVFGGGDHAYYDGTPEVNIIAGTVYRNVYGGGNDITAENKGVNGSKVEMTGGTVLGGLYGGCNTSGVVDGDIVVNINGGTIGSYEKLNTAPSYPTTDVYGGGYGASTSTSGDVRVNINGGTIYGDVYGGSALGEVNAKDGTDTTFVNINGGILETKTTTATTPGGQSYFIYHGGNVYGGGLGRKAVGDDPAIPAKVYGKVYVNIGSVTAWDPDKPGYTLTTAGNATIKGNIYGCNNTYGSPQDDVVVNVYQTAHTPGVDGVDDEGYALANVFGGGNEADFTATGKTTTVNIYSCDNTIQRTFGGSNAAASNSVTTMIQGGRIHEAYGGGNGEVQAANVNGSVTLAIHGGTIGQSFSGSNQNGVISETSTVTIDDAGCGGVEVEEHFCGGNYANWEGDINATIECTAGMHVKRLYGGCKQANVVAHGGQPGNVNLTVKGGTYEYIYGGSQGYINPEDATDTISADIDGSVKLNILGGTVTKAIFGGSHILGKIKGTVVVNVEDLYQGDACPLDLSEADVYGGGNQADYPGKGVTHEGAYNYPQVNIKNATVKNVFGGGLEAEVKGNPQIKIKKGSKIRGNVYGGGNMGEVIGDPKVIVNGKDDTPNPIE